MVVIGTDGRVVLDQNGQVPLAAINDAISAASGLTALIWVGSIRKAVSTKCGIEVTTN